MRHTSRQSIAASMFVLATGCAEDGNVPVHSATLEASHQTETESSLEMDVELSHTDSEPPDGGSKSPAREGEPSREDGCEALLSLLPELPAEQPGFPYSPKDLANAMSGQWLSVNGDRLGVSLATEAELVRLEEVAAATSGSTAPRCEDYFETEAAISLQTADGVLNTEFTSSLQLNPRGPQLVEIPFIQMQFKGTGEVGSGVAYSLNLYYEKGVWTATLFDLVQSEEGTGEGSTSGRSITFSTRAP